MQDRNTPDAAITAETGMHVLTSLILVGYLGAHMCQRDMQHRSPYSQVPFSLHTSSMKTYQLI